MSTAILNGGEVETKRASLDLPLGTDEALYESEAQREKVVEYLRLGVRCVWVVYPKLGVVDVYESSGPVRTFDPEGTLPGDPVLPGLEVDLGPLFSPIGSPRG